MRFPVKDGEWANIDEAEVTRMLRYAIDRVDTAHRYRDGSSDRFLGRVLKGDTARRSGWRPNRPAGRSRPPRISTSILASSPRSHRSATRKTSNDSRC